MVADIESEQDDVRFGSGRLLADLLKFTRIGRTGREPGGSKIIFVGDPCQLPPVKQDFSPALSFDYMTKNHGLTCAEFEIRGIVRQKSDSAILEKAGCLRESIEKGVFNTFDLSSSKDEIVSMSSSEAVSLVAESGNKAVLITYSNQQALELNREVRALIWGNENLPVQVSDTLLVNKNAIKHRLFNGDLVKVTKVSEQVEVRTVSLRNFSPVDLKFRPIQVAYRSSDGKVVYIDCMILENILDSRERALSPLEQRALFVDFRIRNPRLRIGTAEFRNALMSDEYFNALQVKYGYAMTCHKAQGGEWDTAVVQFGDSRGKISESFFRWAYTAITRAKKKLCTIDAPRFTSTSSIKVSFPDSCAVTESTKASPIDDPDFLKLSFRDDKLFLFDIFAKFRDSWQEEGITVDRAKHLPFQEQILVRCGDETATIQYHYNGKGNMSEAGPLLMPGGGIFGDKVLKIARDSLSTCNEEARLPRSPFLEDMEKRIRQSLDGTDIELRSVSSMKYRERYDFLQRGQVIRLDFTYSDKLIWGTMMQVGEVNQHDLMFYAPSRFVADADQTLQLQGRNIVFGLTEKIHGLKPLQKRQLSSVKY
jgi:hypothetical protein